MSNFNSQNNSMKKMSIFKKKKKPITHISHFEGFLTQ